MVLRQSDLGLFYGCSTFPTCKLVHSAHPDGRPMGRPGTEVECRARNRAHLAFDQLWKPNAFAKPMYNRAQAYAWLGWAMKLKPHAAHIGFFDEKQCTKLIALVEAKLKEKARDVRKDRNEEGEEGV